MNKRLHLLDALRGVTLISMTVFHGMWNLVYLFGMKADWYRGTPGYIWQQWICWTFILLSGFCWNSSPPPTSPRRAWRRSGASSPRRS